MRSLAELPADVRAKVTVQRWTRPVIHGATERRWTCWRWSPLESNGYGRAMHEGRRIGAHRLVYELLVGRIPAGMVIDHLCCNRACVNPDHLRVVTHRENILAAHSAATSARNARRTHCPKGHALTSSTRADGRRECAACKRAATRKRLARMRRSTPAAIPHGLGGYTNHACRCDVCRAAAASYAARRRRAAAP